MLFDLFKENLLKLTDVLDTIVLEQHLCKVKAVSHDDSLVFLLHVFLKEPLIFLIDLHSWVGFSVFPSSDTVIWLARISFLLLWLSLV